MRKGEERWEKEMGEGDGRREMGKRKEKEKEKTSRLE